MAKATDDMMPGGPVAERLKELLAKKKAGELTDADTVELAAINGLLMGANALDIADRHTEDKLDALGKAKKIIGGE